MLALGRVGLPVCALRSSLILLVLMCACAAQKRPVASKPRQHTKTTLTLYFSKETDKERAMWLVRPYGLEIVGATEKLSAVSFAIRDQNERRRQAKRLSTDDNVGALIDSIEEIPPIIFAIPTSPEDLKQIAARLKEYGLEAFIDTYPATVSITVDSDDIEEWELRFASDHEVTLIGVGNVLRATEHVGGMLGGQYADVRQSMVAKEWVFHPIIIDGGPIQVGGKDERPPMPAQDLSRGCTVQNVSGVRGAIVAEIEYVFGRTPDNKYVEASKTASTGDDHKGLVEYTISGMHGWVTNKWEYYKLDISFDATEKEVLLRGFMEGRSVSAARPPGDEKDHYPEDVESGHGEKFESQLLKLLAAIETRFCSAQGGK
jgi:hypothetical protein